MQFREYLKEAKSPNRIKNILSNEYRDLVFDIRESDNKIVIEWNFSDTLRGEMLPNVGSIISVLHKNKIIPKKYLTHSNLSILELEY